VPPGGVRHLAVLEVKARAGKISKLPTWSWCMWVTITSSTRAASMSSRASPSRGLRMILRLRRAPVSSEKPVSITKVRSGDLATHRKKSSGIGPSWTSRKTKFSGAGRSSAAYLIANSS
jgi:hypothetical protein